MIKGTQTEKNLQTALEMEGKLKTKFAYFAHIAKEEGQIEAFNAFKEIAGDIERSPSIRWHSILEEEVMYTYENLLEASKMYDNLSEQYLEFARVAKEEKLPVVAAYFINVAKYDLEEKAYFEEFSNYLKQNTENTLN